jgi:hypothetical protein
MKTILISFACLFAFNSTAQSSINWSNLFDKLLNDQHHRKIQESIIDGGFVMKESEFKGDIETRNYVLKPNMSDLPSESISYTLKADAPRTIQKLEFVSSNLNTIASIKKEFDGKLENEQFNCTLKEGSKYEYEMTLKGNGGKTLKATCIEYTSNNKLQFVMTVTVN